VRKKIRIEPPEYRWFETLQYDPRNACNLAREHWARRRCVRWSTQRASVGHYLLYIYGMDDDLLRWHAHYTIHMCESLFNISLSFGSELSMDITSETSVRSGRSATTKECEDL
jgi:hypothetical protein